MRHLACWFLCAFGSTAIAVEPVSFATQVQPLLTERCLHCHNSATRKGGLSLARRADLLTGGANGLVLTPGQPAKSRLLDMIRGPRPRMPRAGKPLDAEQVALLTRWIAEGADWPADLELRPSADAVVWWSLRPLQRPPIPTPRDARWIRNPIDAFILDALVARGLSPSPEADRRTLLRRVTFDLHGLPPTPEEIDAFLRDNDPLAYEKVVDRLLASPRYGERWARHWLDVVHYGDTHGYDKDKLRPNAWPYRDYVIRALNDDRPYSRFLEEQIAGDLLSPNTPDGIAALGFLAAGPWDFVGHVELREGTLDKAITRNLDRDDMVATVLNTTISLTVQCARCHDHKFDPISQEDYYSLQAVFAAIDRADRPFDADPSTAERRRELQRRAKELETRRADLQARVAAKTGPALAALDRQIDAITQTKPGAARPEFGYHSTLTNNPNEVKWVQVDLGRPTAIAHIFYVGCHDTFNNIGAGFGFPVRFKLEISDDPEFRTAQVVEDQTRADVPNPGVKPRSVAVGGKKARYVRMTAIRLAERANDYMFALGELSVLTPDGANAALRTEVKAKDSIEAPPRWRRTNLVDGYYYGAAEKDRTAELAQLQARRADLLDQSLDAGLRKELKVLESAEKALAVERANLPPPSQVFAAATEFTSAGGFRPTGGAPRPIYLLKRGNEKHPEREVGPGALGCVAGLPARFPLPAHHTEGDRRLALTRWLLDPANPLTWRSIVNRVWLYHFGQGIVETPNDFGRMGGRPSHPELLDWLAVEFRDQGQSLKRLHRLLVTSAAYRQASTHRPESARVDSGNRLLWRMNRRRLEAEAIRDSVLAVAGRLDSRMGGPGYRPFGFKDDHSPRYLYEEHDPDDPASHRRSIYRFLVRSVPEPFMETLDCADPSQIVERRNETLTALQALTLLNNRFMVRMAEHLADRVRAEVAEPTRQPARAFQLALGRAPSEAESNLLREVAARHGLANACRVIFNLNEFCLVD